MSLGLVLLAVFLFFLAGSGISATFVTNPAATPPGVPTSAEALVSAIATGLFAVLVLGTLYFVGVGLMGLRRECPEARAQLTWRIGGVPCGPLRVIGLFVLFILLGTVAGVTLGLAGAVGASFYLAAFTGAMASGIGWCVMVFPMMALKPWTTPTESKAVSLVIAAITLAVMFAAGAGFLAAAIGASMLESDPALGAPPSYPWVQGFTALVGFAGLLVVAWVARRIVKRMRRTAAGAVPSVA